MTIFVVLLVLILFNVPVLPTAQADVKHRALSPCHKRCKSLERPLASVLLREERII